MTMRIQTRDNRTEFFPGEEIVGRVEWQLTQPPQSVELRLFWYTRGKGDQDVDVVHNLPFENPSTTDRRDFRIQLPDAPYSFSGKLISLTWALELVAQPSGETERVEIMVTPTGSEIQLAAPSDTNV
jgi:hypothetical protein